jgi:hypothetical protein
MIFREGFLSKGQVRRLSRNHELVQLPEGVDWKFDK